MIFTISLKEGNCCMKFLRIVLCVALALFCASGCQPLAATSSPGSHPASTPKSSAAGLTDQQLALCKLNDDYLSWQAPPPETNPIKIATAPPVKEPDWNGRLQAILGDGTFTDWKVVLYSMIPNEYREVWVNVHYTCPAGKVGILQIDLSTSSPDRSPWPHPQSKFPATSPKLGSDFSNLLSNSKQGDTLTVSGTIFSGPRYGGFPFPTTYTPIGRQNRAAREFVVRFDKMSK